VKQGPNKGQIVPAIIRKIPLQNISQVSARFVADGSVNPLNDRELSQLVTF